MRERLEQAVTAAELSRQAVMWVWARECHLRVKRQAGRRSHVLGTEQREPVSSAVKGELDFNEVK